MNTNVSTWPNRTLCEVLEDMRRCQESQNYGPMKSLIEEAQIFGNRMEAGLENNRTYKEMDKALHELKKEYRPLRDEIKDLENKKDKLKIDLERVENSSDDSTN